MREEVLKNSIGQTASGSKPLFGKAVVFGGLTVGMLDGLAATINAARGGVSFSRVWQFVASGVLGREAFNYGWATVALGLLIHFFIAFAVVAAYFLASRRFPVLVRQAVVGGVVYGAGVYFFMNHLVAPLSAAPRLPFSFSALAIGLLIHVFLVGLPSALIASRFSK